MLECGLHIVHLHLLFVHCLCSVFASCIKSQCTSVQILYCDIICSVINRDKNKLIMRHSTMHAICLCIVFPTPAQLQQCNSAHMIIRNEGAYQQRGIGQGTYMWAS